MTDVELLSVLCLGGRDQGFVRSATCADPTGEAMIGPLDGDVVVVWNDGYCLHAGAADGG